MKTSEDTARFEEACEWFLRLREAAESTQAVAEWSAWCRADVRNLRSFEDVNALWWETRTIKPGANDLSSAPGTPRNAHLAGWRRRGLSAVAAIILVAIGGITAYFALRPARAPQGSISLSTLQREHRIFMLSDGSSIELAGDSRLSGRLDQHQRSLLLERGEAYFQVAKDPRRPFIVTAGGTHVTALGTRFNVRSSDHLLVVAVEEGLVVVERPSSAPSLVGRGQEVSVGSHTVELASIEPGAVASWRQGRLRFTREPLRSVVASVFAASGQRIELADERLGDFQFTGTVFSSSVSDWVEGLPSIYPVRVRREGLSYVVSVRD